MEGSSLQWAHDDGNRQSESREGNSNLFSGAHEPFSEWSRLFFEMKKAFADGYVE